MLIVNAARNEREVGNRLRLGHARLKTSDRLELMLIEHLHQVGAFRLVNRRPELHRWCRDGGEA